MSKGKVIATKYPLKELIPFLEEGGSKHKMSNLKSFAILEGQLTAKDIIAQAKEMKRLADLKVKNEKSEESLKKMLNPATVKAQTQKMAQHEAKRAKMLKEFNDYINKRADQLPITKISYKITSSQDATMRIMMRYLAFRRHLEEIHVTWAHLEKKRTRLRTYTNISQEFLLKGWRRHHKYT
ncbi:hypothetical protein Tco_0611120 [Tanacetum coccineum]